MMRCDLNGRGERIRTSDLTVPNRALYQAEPRPECRKMITRVEERRAKSKRILVLVLGLREKLSTTI